MGKYHYELIVNLTKIEKSLAQAFFGDTITTFSDKQNYATLYLDTNNRLTKDEILAIASPEGSLLHLELTTISRYVFQIRDNNKLVELDASEGSLAAATPIINDEVWFTCNADAVMVSIINPET